MSQVSYIKLEQIVRQTMGTNYTNHLYVFHINTVMGFPIDGGKMRKVPKISTPHQSENMADLYVINCKSNIKYIFFRKYLHTIRFISRSNWYKCVRITVHVYSINQHKGKRTTTSRQLYSNHV